MDGGFLQNFKNVKKNSENDSNNLYVKDLDKSSVISVKNNSDYSSGYTLMVDKYQLYATDRVFSELRVMVFNFDRSN